MDFQECLFFVPLVWELACLPFIKSFSKQMLKHSKLIFWLAYSFLHLALVFCLRGPSLCQSMKGLILFHLQAF